MSLMSRVRDIDDVPTLAASADDNALERLKEHIQRFVSTDDIAAIMAEQPSRARNELKSACRQAFEDASWAGVSQREQQRLTDGLIDMVFGFGPLESLLADDSVTEIMVNGPSDVFFERDGRLHRSEQRFADEGQLRALIDRVLGPLGYFIVRTAIPETRTGSPEYSPTISTMRTWCLHWWIKNIRSCRKSHSGLGSSSGWIICCTSLSPR